jgi:hypothetical protein
MSQKKIKNKSPGWAAFDLKQKQHLKFEVENEPYPPISSSSSQNVLKNDFLSVRPFSSVLSPTVDFSTLPQKLLPSSNFDFDAKNQSSKPKNEAKNYEGLKSRYNWADKSLIEDIMAAVNNNFDEASTLLEVIVSNDASNNYNDGADLIENGIFNNKEVIDVEHDCILVEPEWEDDDIYIIQRKDAMKMMRSAYRHSKAGNDAYLRGDHLTAQLISVKAKEEWKAAESLNAKAANEILNIRNANNDIWTLDLHGLHSTEAVQALKEHLRKLEESQRTLAHNNNSHVNSTGGNIPFWSIGSSNHTDKMVKQQTPSWQRPTMLQVITGKGNHSRGLASLPVAIKNFLCINRYHYDDRRPGVIVVKPKFRWQAS